MFQYLIQKKMARLEYSLNLISNTARITFNRVFVLMSNESEFLQVSQPLLLEGYVVSTLFHMVAKKKEKKKKIYSKGMDTLD